MRTTSTPAVDASAVITALEAADFEVVVLVAPEGDEAFVRLTHPSGLTLLGGGKSVSAAWLSVNDQYRAQQSAFIAMGKALVEALEA